MILSLILPAHFAVPVASALMSVPLRIWSWLKVKLHTPGRPASPVGIARPRVPMGLYRTLLLIPRKASTRPSLPINSGYRTGSMTRPDLCGLWHHGAHVVILSKGLWAVRFLMIS